MPKTLDIHDRQALQASLARWQIELAKDRRVLTKREHLIESARQRVQHASAVVDRRLLQISRLPKHDHRHAALSEALSFVGITEHPAGSNDGPHIHDFQAHFGAAREPWCGFFVGYCAEVGGHANVTARIGYTPYILEDALAHQHGVARVVWTRQGGFNDGAHSAHTFDLVLFDFGGSAGIVHVGALREPWNGNGTLHTVEGNTSFGPGGSQNNGGAVAKRDDRYSSEVRAIVSLQWPS